MAKIIYTDTVQLSDLDLEQQDWLYNAKDCCVPHQIYESLTPRLSENRRRIYRFELAQQAVAWSMLHRGIRVNANARDQALHELGTERARINSFIDRMATMMWGKGLNPKSPVQLKAFFYDFLGLPIHYRQDGQRRVPTTNIEALQSFEPYLYVRPVVNALLASGDLHGQIKVLAAGTDPDGRFRASFNVGGTETGRWSSSKNPNGRGSNFQNITPRARHIFVADEGEVLVGPDLEQAESRAVAYLSGDENYIRACESSDLHTAVAKLIWPDAEWTGDEVQDGKLAREPNFYRHFSRRDLAKRAGHLTNYWGSHFKLAAVLGIELAVAEKFQQDYFTAFPGIKRWHERIVEALQVDCSLTTPFGRERTFFGRTSNDKTIKEAVASIPQSTIADLFNLGLLKTWRHLQLEEGRIHCLLQAHDGALLGVPEDDVDTLIPRIRDYMTIPLQIGGREMVVPVDFKVGYNWRDMKNYGSPEAAALRRDDMTYDPMKWTAA